MKLYHIILLYLGCHGVSLSLALGWSKLISMSQLESFNLLPCLPFPFDLDEIGLVTSVNNTLCIYNFLLNHKYRPKPADESGNSAGYYWIQ